MVERNLTVPYRFVCFTDSTVLHKQREFRGKDIEFRQFKRHDFEGWFNKLQLFSPDSKLEGDTLYMDLDVVIMKNIDELATIGESKNFVGMNDFNPSSGLFNSSIMRFNNQYHSIIWKEYLKRKTEFNNAHGDQDIISAIIKSHEDTIAFPDSWTQSYKWLNRKGERYHIDKMTYEQDPNAKVCVFHGNPNPDESPQEWVKELWK
jgi:alpha-N-acetylglucosamine transferase